MSRGMGRVLRWGTFALAVLVAVVWAGGEWTHYQRTFTTSKREVAIYACWGGVMVIHQDMDVRRQEYQSILDRGLDSGPFPPDPPGAYMFEDSGFMEIRSRLELRREFDRQMRVTHEESILGMWLPRWTVQGDFNRSMMLRVPYWLLFVALACFSGGLFLVSYLRSRRAKAGHCTACNYSLAGLAPTAACPECGVGRVKGGATTARPS